MGVTNEFDFARQLCRDELRFDIGGDATAFRALIERAGQRRVKHCVTLIGMWARPHHTGAQKYERLMRLLQMITPEKAPGTKYRDPQSQAGVEMNAEMDRQMANAIAREP